MTTDQSSLPRGYPSWRAQSEPGPDRIDLRSATSRGFRISYEDAGEGSPVVLIPGFTMSAADWREVGYVAALAGSHRVLSVDPLGHGESDKPHAPEAYLWPDVSADVIAVLDAASVGRAVLWGYSRGATLACVAAIEHPERVAALVMGGSGNVAGPMEGPIPAWIEALCSGDWNALWNAVPYSTDDQRYAMERFDPCALGAAGKGRRLSSYVVGLERISARALVYCGTEDDPDDVEPTARALRTHVQLIDGADHDGGFTSIDRVLPLAMSHLEAAS